MYTLAGVVNCQTGLLVVNKAMQVQCRDIRIVFGMGQALDRLRHGQVCWGSLFGSGIADTGNGTQITTLVSSGTSFGGRFGPREF